MREKILLHAVVRFDHYFSEVAEAVTVVAVVPTREEADSEVARLNELNAGKGSVYFWTPARYFPEGRGAGLG